MEGAPTKWFYRSWFLIVMLIIFPPVGIILLWMGGTWGKGAKIGATVVSSIILIAALAGKKDEGSVGAAAPTASAPSAQGTAEAPKPAVKPADPENTSAKIGDMITFKDSEWVVVAAKNAGATLSSHNAFMKPLSTSGKYVVVNFTVTNRTKKEDRLLNHPVLVDAKEREFRNLDSQAFYIPENANTLGLEALPPDMKREFWAVYEVPADATDLKFQARALSSFGGKRLVSLGF